MRVRCIFFDLSTLGDLGKFCLYCCQSNVVWRV